MKPKLSPDHIFKRVSVLKLIELGLNPYEDCPWGVLDVLSMADVKDCIERKSFQSEYKNPTDYTADEHIMRVAYLVVNPDRNPISIDVGMYRGYEGEIHLDDGWHRLAAAIYRGDKTIKVDPAGCISRINSVFKVYRVNK